jgi:hypothetical protein
VQEWFNRIGLVLQFVALFLLTPDIFGRERMETAATKLRKLTHQITAGILNRIKKRYGTLPLGIAAEGLYIIIGLGILFISHLPQVHWLAWVAGPIIFSGSLSLIRLVATLPLFFTGWLLERLLKRSFLPLGTMIFGFGFILLPWATWLPA